MEMENLRESKTTKTIQDFRINWVIPKNFGNFDRYFEPLKTPKLATIPSPSTPSKTVKTTEKTQDNRINWVIPKNFGKYDGKLELLKISKFSINLSLPTPTTNSETKIQLSYGPFSRTIQVIILT